MLCVLETECGEGSRLFLQNWLKLRSAPWASVSPEKLLVPVFHRFWWTVRSEGGFCRRSWFQSSAEAQHRNWKLRSTWWCHWFMQTQGNSSSCWCFRPFQNVFLPGSVFVLGLILLYFCSVSLVSASLINNPQCGCVDLSPGPGGLLRF